MTSNRDVELDRLRGEVDQLRDEAGVTELAMTRLRAELATAREELLDLRAIRDALTPPELPTLPGMELAASFLPASHRVSGDFYLAAPGPDGTAVLVIGDVVGHGIEAARRAAFVRTAFASTATFTDDPSRLLEWANLALIEGAGESDDFVTAACVTYRHGSRTLRWATAGHPPPLWLSDGCEADGAQPGRPLGIASTVGGTAGMAEMTPDSGVVLYTDGLTEARQSGELFGLERVSEFFAQSNGNPLRESLDELSSTAASFTADGLQDDLCILAARLN
jgi:serine phosphatase RsbU (regulator of sigma subunit)